MVEVNWFDIVAASIAVISLSVNAVQWVKRSAAIENLTSALRSHSQSSYNHFNAIAHLTQRVQEYLKRGREEEVTKTDITKALMEATRISGITDAARHETVSYCGEHLEFTPTVQKVIDLTGDES